jgi:hypothetical protein
MNAFYFLNILKVVIVLSRDDVDSLYLEIQSYWDDMTINGR